MKGINHLNLRGGSLLIIADKHAKKNGLKICDLLDDVFCQRIEESFASFVKKVDDTGFEFPQFSGVGQYYGTLKSKLKKSIVKDIEFKVE